MTDGLEFEAGALVDHSLVGDANLRRLAAAHYIRPVALDADGRAA
jgi:hypothetical protein